MGNLDIGATIPLIILVGFFSSIIASMIGLGGGLIAVPLIMLVIGEHSLQAKLIAYTSIAVLSIVASVKYYRAKRKPKFKEGLLILLGVIPTTMLVEIFVGPLLSGDNLKPYFHMLYAIVTLLVMILINLKDKIKIKKLSNYTLPFFGVGIGALSGSIGLSGGVLFMPLLIVGLKMDLKQAAVTSLLLKMGAAIANLIAGVASNQFQTFEQNGVLWYLPLIIIIGSVAGSFIGPMIQQKISQKTMNILFNIVMTSILIWEIVKTILLFA